MARTETGAGPPALGKLSRLRRGSGDKNASSTSLANSAAGDTADSPVSAVVDATIDKIRSKTRRRSVQADGDDRRGSGESPSRLSKLLSGKRSRLRKTPSSDNIQRPLSETSATSNTGLAGYQSDSSIGVEGSGYSSLLTDDNSEQEG